MGAPLAMHAVQPQALAAHLPSVGRACVRLPSGGCAAVLHRRPTPFGTLRLVNRKVAAVDYDDALPVDDVALGGGDAAPNAETPRRSFGGGGRGGGRRGGGRRGRSDRMPIKYQMEDLYVGQQLEGVVTGTTTYGAFVDIGTVTDGLIHISQLTDGFVENVNDVISRGDTVVAKIVNIDTGLKRIGLTLRDDQRTSKGGGGGGGGGEDGEFDF